MPSKIRGLTSNLHLISWNGRAPKYDIRDWSPEREKMGKGITLTIDDLKELKNALNELDELL
ncbi:YdbC family protein [Ornithinibacillus californiensis]|uniref:YdbC family protein n=1 Tax=Ornithinibacillus californiensis TaxID=161536 RepID=UPI0009FE8154|nr:PC4/YdbC family ssDNA-binding protein [Ornithinibacillus californiensis]